MNKDELPIGIALLALVFFTLIGASVAQNVHTNNQKADMENLREARDEAMQLYQDKVQEANDWKNKYEHELDNENWIVIIDGEVFMVTEGELRNGD